MRNRRMVWINDSTAQDQVLDILPEIEMMVMRAALKCADLNVQVDEVRRNEAVINVAAHSYVDLMSQLRRDNFSVLNFTNGKSNHAIAWSWNYRTYRPHTTKIYYSCQGWYQRLYLNELVR